MTTDHGRWVLQLHHLAEDFGWVAIRMLKMTTNSADDFLNEDNNLKETSV